MKKKNIFLKQKVVLFGVICVRLFIFIACISFIGTRIFVGGNAEEIEKSLFSLVQHASNDQVKKLLMKGANPDVLDVEQNTPLFFTGFDALYGEQYVTVMQTLLSFYADVNRQNVRGETVLHACIRTERRSVMVHAVLSLFSYGGDLDIKDYRGNTMLTELVRIDSIPSVEVLLANCADIFGIKRLEAAKALALEYGYTDIADLFSSSIAQLNTNIYKPQKDRGINELLLRLYAEKEYTFLLHQPVVKSRDMFGNTLLHFAVMVGNVPLATFLVEHFPDLVMAKNNAGSYPIHFIARTDVSLETRKNIVALFKKHDVDFNSTDGTGATLLRLLERKKDSVFITYLHAEVGTLKH